VSLLRKTVRIVGLSTSFEPVVGQCRPVGPPLRLRNSRKIIVTTHPPAPTRSAVSLRTSAVVAVLVVAAATLLPAQSTTQHTYFDALVARADHWKSYSLRSAAQLARPADGGYANSNSNPLMVTYAPGEDDNAHAQDAAKVVIPPFNGQSNIKLNSGIGASDLVLRLSDLGGDVTKVATAINAKADQIKVGSEIMVTATDRYPLDRATGILLLSQRGAFGTSAVPHTAGELVHLSGNSLSNQVRVPFDSYDGATWLITWDAYFTDSFLKNGIGAYKAFQLSSSKAIWLEPQVHFNGAHVAPSAFDPNKHVASAGQVRSYNSLGGPADYSQSTENQIGPGVSNNQPIRPNLNEFFIVHPNRWTRWWIRVRQKANDYDTFDLWMADEQTAPVQIYSNIPVSVRDGKIDQFYVEFNTSTDELPPERLVDFRTLVAYVRNIVILRDTPDDVTPFLVRPGAGPQVFPVPRPPAPRNLRLGGVSVRTILPFTGQAPPWMVGSESLARRTEN
jgi:hypothetical protein